MPSHVNNSIAIILNLRKIHKCIIIYKCAFSIVIWENITTHILIYADIYDICRHICKYIIICKYIYIFTYIWIHCRMVAVYAEVLVELVSIYAYIYL